MEKENVLYTITESDIFKYNEHGDVVSVDADYHHRLSLNILVVGDEADIITISYRRYTTIGVDVDYSNFQYYLFREWFSNILNSKELMKRYGIVTLKEKKVDESMMLKAWINANDSKCEKRKVGTVITRDDRVIVDGYNGTLAGADNSCECSNGETLDTVLHAEKNAITYSASEGIKLKGTKMYITKIPCLNCATLIAGSKISEVIFSQPSKSNNDKGLKYLQDNAIPIRQFQLSDIYAVVKTA